MSASNAAAKKRRAIIPPNATDSFPNVGGRSYIPPKSQVPPSPSIQENSSSNAPQSGFTLQQVISLIDARLVNLEKNVTEINKKQSTEETSVQSSTINPATSAQLNKIQEHVTEQTEFNKQIQENFQTVNENMNEYDSRFEILVSEIAELKFIVLKLQTYTMDVNKMLLEERQLADSGCASVNTELDNNSNDNTDLNKGVAGANSVGDDRIFLNGMEENEIKENGMEENEEVKYTLSNPAMDGNGESNIE
jgi:hypothetical protein